MSEDKKTQKTGDFLAGKGFYVILFVCVAVIGISAWILLFTGNPAQVEVDARSASSIEDGVSYTQDVIAEQPSYSEDVFSSQSPQTIKPPEVKQEPKSETSPSPSPTPSQAPPETTTKPPANSNSEDNEPSGGKQKTLEEMTFVWPVAGKIENAFSVDMPVYNRTLAVWRVHTGVDLSAAVGTKVLAVSDGKVVDIYEDDMMGTTVVIDHGNKLMSTYSNLAATPVVKTGDNIAMGAVIGAVGNTALGEVGEVAHLHLEMSLDGDAVDPASYLPTR